MHPSRAPPPSRSLNFFYFYRAWIFAVLKSRLKGMPRLQNLQKRCSDPRMLHFRACVFFKRKEFFGAEL